MKFYIVLSALSLAALPAAAAEADFGMIGVTPFETARLNAFCDGSVVPTPCDVTFEFHDIKGNTLKQASLTLQPEASGFVDFALTTLAALPGRVEIRPCIKVLRGTAQSSLELVENFTQRTRLLIAWTGAAAPKSGADVDFGAAGITRFDTARIGASCQGESTDSPSCAVALEFHDAGGRTIKTSRLTIAPGASAFLDLAFAETGAAGGRVTIDPCWTVATGAAVLSLQTIDTFSGLTITQAYPGAMASALVP